MNEPYDARQRFWENVFLSILWLLNVAGWALLGYLLYLA